MADSVKDSSVKSGPGRQLLPDVLKGVAVLLMIQVHLVELFAQPEIYNSTWGKISLFLGGPPAAPVFMAVMGYFLALSDRSMVSFIGRGIRLIVYGFLLNAGLNMHLFYHIFTGQSSQSPLPYLFGVDILLLAGLSIIVIALFRPILRNKVFLWSIAALLVASFTTFLPAGDIHNSWSDYLLACFYKATWWSYFPLFPWLAYPLAGYSFNLIITGFGQTNIPLTKFTLAALAMLIPLAVFFPFGFKVTTDLQAYYHHSVSYFIWALLFLGVWATLFFLFIKYLPGNPLMKYLKWTGRNVTAFYVFQWLIIGNLATTFYKSVSAVQLIPWFAGILFITSLLVWIYRIAVEKYRKIKDLAIR
ncbi:MAG: heparan-alpha-glucosaminide N-acetyltransferase domain-containing protein [Lentimicrobium sp.]